MINPMIENFIDNLKTYKNNKFDTCCIYEFNHTNFSKNDMIVVKLLDYYKQYKMTKLAFAGARPETVSDYYDELINYLPFSILEIQKHNVYSVDSTFVTIKTEQCQIYDYIKVIDFYEKNWLRFPKNTLFRLRFDIQSLLCTSFENFYSSSFKWFDNHCKPLFAFDYSFFSRNVFEWSLCDDSRLFELEISVVPFNAAIINLDLNNKTFTSTMIIRLFHDNILIQDKQYFYSDPSRASCNLEYEELCKNESLIFRDFFLPFTTDLSEFEPLDFKKTVSVEYIENFNKNIRLLKNAIDI